MKKLTILLFALLCAGAVFGKDKEVAVMKPYVMGGATVSETDKLIMVGAMIEAFTNIDGYKAFSRTSQKLIDAEMAFQRSGKVSDDQIKAVGEQAGVAYICTFTLAIEGKELVISSNIIDVVTAEIINAKILVCLDRTDRADIIEKCESLPYKLLKVNQGASGGSSSNVQKPASGKNMTFTANGVTFEMIFVEGGTFVMGCTSEQSDCSDWEKPTHSVTLSDYYIGQYQVTQKLWQAVMGTTVKQQRDTAVKYFQHWGGGWEKSDVTLRSEGDNYPMYYICYYECEKFCAKLNKLLSNQLPDGYKFSFPTEAQWEYAARGGKKSKGYKYSGSNDASKVAWYISTSQRETHEVGMKEKNELGIYDMSGNVWEQCQDCIESYCGPYGPCRIKRGGAWNSNTTADCRVSACKEYLSAVFENDLGFRLALVP